MSETKNHFGFESPGPGTGWKSYRKKTVVQMLRMDEPFTCTNREGENMQGFPGDYLVPDGYGGWYPVGSKFHEENYEEV